MQLGIFNLLFEFEKYSVWIRLNTQYMQKHKGLSNKCYLICTDYILVLNKRDKCIYNHTKKLIPVEKLVQNKDSLYTVIKQYDGLLKNKNKSIVANRYLRYELNNILGGL